ncbi:hypothetical protein [Jiella marina]|uniref:hypothetical protein n=1 Tax=Jiella sp. LLJ827 TaxID=2917712 RepID=UPI002101956C|nr:hypothetical protein [Jiella sp. LLJ827]MCQ0986379.1 hypothetical protein [Jiella sp. LLJ827]
MAFVLRTRRGSRIDSEAIASRGVALTRYEAAWHGLRGSDDWAVALYECPGITDPDAAVETVSTGGGLILEHRDSRIDEVQIRELRRRLEGK